MYEHLSVPSGTILKPILSRQTGKYFAGSDGHIYCYSSANPAKNKPRPFRLTESDGSRGYRIVSLCDAGRRYTINVHRLVCEAFHGALPSATSVVRHYDGDRRNNRPSNLRWGTYAENEADKKRHGRVAAGERHGNAKLSEEAVKIIRASIPFGLWNTADAAKVFGVDDSTIRRIASGKKDWQAIL